MPLLNPAFLLLPQRQLIQEINGMALLSMQPIICYREIDFIQPERSFTGHYSSLTGGRADDIERINRDLIVHGLYAATGRVADANSHTKSSPKVIWEECVATSHGRKCTRPLHVLAVQCPLQTSPVTQPWVHYIYAMIPHQSFDSSVPNCNLYHNPNPTYRTNPTTTAS